MKRILILGGGMGGVEAAIVLTQKLKGDYQIDLISNRDFLYIYPASIWLTVGKRTLEDLSVPLPQLAEIHGFNFLQEEVKEVRAKEQLVLTTSQEHSYDYLIIALGSSKLKPKGVENMLSICGSPADGMQIQERFLELVKRGEGKIACGFSGNPQDATAVRGGPVFEVLFNFDTHLRQEGIRDRFELTFFSPSDAPGKRLGAGGLAQLQQLFQERGITTVTGKKIKEFTSSGVTFEDDTQVVTDLTVFTPGMTGTPILKQSDLPLTVAGFVTVSDTAQVNGFENCYAIGDSSYFEGPDWRARQGHLAEVMARTAAENIARQERREAASASFREEINLLCIMDTGKEGVFVYRDENREMARRGAWARWAKLAWEKYYKLNKLGKVPRVL
jgi:sulfide:quinone oxidoreductase